MKKHFVKAGKLVGLFLAGAVLMWLILNLMCASAYGYEVNGVSPKKTPVDVDREFYTKIRIIEQLTPIPNIQLTRVVSNVHVPPNYPSLYVFPQVQLVPAQMNEIKEFFHLTYCLLAMIFVAMFIPRERK